MHSVIDPESGARNSSPGTRAPSFADVFAGCGGLSLGLKRSGWKGVFAIEKDHFAFETLLGNFPPGDDHFSYSWPRTIERRPWDICSLLSERGDALKRLAGKIDLLAGGPPCQGFSAAGRRRADDPRNKLFEAYLQLVDMLSPRMVLIENVRGFASDFKSARPGTVENFAEALQQGLVSNYDVNSKIIQARNFGVPQTRPRFFLVGALKEIGAKREIESFFDDLERRAGEFLAHCGLPHSPTALDAISDLEIARNGTVPSTDSKGFQSIAYKEKVLTPYQQAMRGTSRKAPTDLRLARHRPDIRDRFEAIIKTCRDEGRLNTAISAEIRKEHGLKKRAIRVLDPLCPAPTITSLPDDLLHYSEPRTLTVRENARLQSFPDWFSFSGKYTTGGDRRRREVPRFTQVANAVPPLLAEQLGLVLLGIIRCSRAKLFFDGSTHSIKRVPVAHEVSTKVGHPSVVDLDVFPVVAS